MNNYHDIVYVPSPTGMFSMKTLDGAIRIALRKDVFVFTKEEFFEQFMDFIDFKNQCPHDMARGIMIGLFIKQQLKKK